MPPDRSALQKKAHREFNETLKSKPTDKGFVRYQDKLSRLPDELYPIKVDGKKISGSAVQRIHLLEKRLDHPRNKSLKEGVHARVQALIQDKMLIKIGNWHDYEHEFLKDQEPGNEKLVIPWQTVLDATKAAEHSKIRMCLD